MTNLNKHINKMLNTSNKQASAFHIVGQNVKPAFNEIMMSILRNTKWDSQKVEINFIGYNNNYETIFSDDKYHQTFLQHDPAFINQSTISGKITTILKLMKNEALRRQTIIQTSNTKNIDEYNQISKDKIAYSMLIITDIDLVIKHAPHAKELINDLLNTLKDTNITILMTSHNPLTLNRNIFIKNI